MRNAATACLLIALAAPQALSSQDRPPVPPVPTLRITVTLVQVDAVVTDSSGRHVTDLRPEDFEILQDGEVQKITHFSFQAAPAPAHVPDPKAGHAAGDPPIGPPQPVTPGEIRRTVALVVDDLSLSFENLVRVREGLRKYVEQQMQPGDLVALLRTGGGVAILEQFTTDKRILLEAIDLLKWRFSGRAGILPIERLAAAQPAGQGRSAPQSLDYDSSVSALGALDTLEEVIEGMKSRPGRKSVVFFSDSLRVDAGINSAIDRLTDHANRSAVSIYPIDPNGIKVRDAEVRPSIPYTRDPGSVMGFPPIFGGEGEFRQQEGLQALASRTGGVFYKNNNDLPGLIQTATNDQLGYYLLGYSPQEGTFDQVSGKPKFHRVQVKVLRRGLEVRWKGGFHGVSDESLVTTSNAPKTREQQLMDALASPFAATGLKVRLTSLFAQTKRDGPFVHSLLQFGARDLAFHHDESGVWKASVEVVTVVYRGFKQPFQQRLRKQEINIPDAQWAAAQKEGFLMVLDDKIREPGTFLMRAVVRDTASERIGSASQYIQVPDTRKGQLALSGVVLQTAPASLMRPAGDSPPANGDGEVEAWTEGGPAVRRYRPGLNILCTFEVINPKLKGSHKEPGVLTQVRVFRNGQLLFTGKVDHVVSPSLKDPNRYFGGEVLRLGSALAPGEYLVQVLVTDEFAPKRHSQAAQWMDFEVVPAAPGPLAAGISAK